MKPRFFFEWPPGPQVCRSPQAIGVVIAGALINAGVSVVIANALGLAIGYGLVAAAAIGLQMALMPKPATPKPSDVQSNIKQEISPRRKIYGRYLTGSVIVFGFRRGEKIYVLHYICEGPISGYVSFRLDKKPVTLDANGFVQEAQYQVGGRSRVQILTTRGTSTDGPFAALLTAFPELNTPLTPFRHRNCAMVLQIVEQVPQEKLQDVYPNNLPGLQVVIDGFSEVYDPRTGITGFSDNAGCCLLTEVMDVYGLTPSDVDELALSSFSEFAVHCDELVALKAGGTERRYRCAGLISLDGENEGRIKAIADVCNADVFMDRQGRMTVQRKMRSVPGIALRARNGDHLTVQIEGGRGLQKLSNMIKVTYVDPSLNWKANEVIWRHFDLIEEDGIEYSTPLELLLCPSSSQAQRLGKLRVYEMNPEFSGSLTAGPQALDLMEDYVFTLDLSPEETFERVACVSGSIDYDGETMTVSAPFVIFRDGAESWNAATDEQDDIVVPVELPSYVNDIGLSVTVTVVVPTNSAPYLLFSWTGVGGATVPDSYSHNVEVSPADAAEWSAATVTQAADTAKFFAIADGAAYDWRIRNVASGKTFDWQYSTVPVTVVVDNVAPVGLTAFSASDGTGQFVANFGTTNDPHLYSVAIYKVPVGTAFNAAAHLVAPPFVVAPGIAYALPITSAAGAYNIYARPFNRSSKPGPLSGPDAATVS